MFLRLFMVIAFIFGSVVFLTLIVEIPYYGIRWIITGKGFPSNPFIVTYYTKLFTYYENRTRS